MTTDNQQPPILIMLTGGRSTPAILGALSLKPQPRAVEFITSRDEVHREKEIRKVLPKKMIQTDEGISVSAYNMQETIDACQALMERHNNGPFMINLSSGTKIMALGAYEFAKRKSISALYVDTVGEQIIDLVTDDSCSLSDVDVKAYLSYFGRDFHPKFDASKFSIPFEQALQVTRDLVKLGEPALNVLERIRIDGKGKDEPRTKRIKNYAPSQNEEQVWNYLVDVGLLKDTQQRGGVFKFTIKRHGDYAFLEGDWLEMYCWDEVRQQPDEKNALFDDVQFSVELPSNEHGARKEIDVAAMYRGQIIICSCKAGTNKIWSTGHLDELRAVSSLIGGKFCSRIFIAAKHPPEKTQHDAFQAYQRFCNQAKDREIVVITGEQLENIGTAFAEQAKKPKYRRV